ncbi:BTB/POZ domain-containing protein 8-like isoform X2 [Heterodontus francisci]|uniref:BTB/POZ domain-containing protein 8-like isoform X2 n=1 Tax=Heterodontus francisci TaxID=7792 RepID=UPI00355C16DB
MESEGFDETSVTVDVSNKTTKEDNTAAVEGSMSKQKNGGPVKAKQSLKPTTGSQGKAKVGITGRQPISTRPASALQSKVGGGSRKNNVQEQKASTPKTLPGSSASPAKIMKKMAANDKAVKENVNGACGASGNGNRFPQAEKSRGPTKVLPTSRALPKGKNPALLRPSSTASKKPAAVGTAKLPAAKPEKPLQNKSSRPDTMTSSHSTPNAGASVKKQPAPRTTIERPPRAQPGVPSMGVQPGKLSAASSKKDLTPSSSQSKYSSFELNRAANTVKSTKPKPMKYSEAKPADQKNLNARLKNQVTKVSVKPTPKVQPGTSTSKASVGTVHQQSTQASKRNVEKQTLPRKRLSTSSRKSLSENDIGKTRAEQIPLQAEPVKSAEAQTIVKKEPLTLNTALSNEDVVAMNPQGYLTIEKVPSQQGVEIVPCLGNTEVKNSTSFEEKVENKEVEANACMGEPEAAESGGNMGSVKTSGQLAEENKGVLNYGQMLEVGLCSNYSGIDEGKDARVIDRNEYYAAKVIKVDLNQIEAEQNMNEKVAGIDGKMYLNSESLEVQDLQSQYVLHESTSSSEEKESLNPAMDGSQVDNVSATKGGNVVPVSMLDLVDPKEPTLGSSLEDESSPETNSNVSNVEKVKLTMYEYSEEADTEESPTEVCPETLQSRDLVFEPHNLLVETMQISSKTECPVGNQSSGEKLGISPEDSREDPGVSKSSTLSGPDLAGKSSSTTSTPEELKDYDSSSGVESKSDEKLEFADLGIRQTDELRPLDDLLDQDLGIHLERGDEEPETLAADDLHGDPPTESVVSSEEDDHFEADHESVTGEHIQCGLEGIDNPVFEDKTESNSEVLSLASCSPHFKPLTLHAVDEGEELATAETLPCLGRGRATSDSLAAQHCVLSGTGSLQEDPTSEQIASQEKLTAMIGQHSFGPNASLSIQNHCFPQNECLKDVAVVTVADHEGDLAEDSSESNQPKSCNVEEIVASYPIDCLDGDLTNVQKLNSPTTDPNGGHVQQYCSSEKNDSILTGILSEGDKTLQTHACVPWMTPLLPPILSTIYEVETAEETRLEDDFEKGELQKPDWQCLELIEDPSNKVLTLQIEPVEVVQQLINQTLLLSGDGVKLQSKVMVDKAELSKWTDLISPLDDSTASITSVTSFSPEDISSSQGEWTVVELETHH